MEHGSPPVALVETWVFVATSESYEISTHKTRAHKAINDLFGSVEIAQIYIDRCRGKQEVLEFI